MAATIRIDEIRVTQVVVPVHPIHPDDPTFTGPLQGEAWGDLPICVLEVVFSDGVIGLAEVGRGQTIEQIRPWLRPLVGHEMPLGLLLGKQPKAWERHISFHLEEIFPRPLWDSASPIHEVLACASLDAQGKRLGARAVDLLGGAYREKFPVDTWCARRSPDDLRKIVEQAKARGFRGLKMKSRAGDPVVAQASAVRDAGGADFGLTIDPMFQWLSPNHVMTLIKPLEDLGLVNLRVEDPFPQDQPDFWKRWQQASRIPLIWHARGAAPLRRALQHNCAEAFNLSGGTAEVLSMAHAIELTGHVCWFGSSLEMGIGQASRMHAAAASRPCTMACDFMSGLVREHTLITWDWPYKDGYLPLPQGPGLGVELDRDALRHYAQAQETFA